MGPGTAVLTEFVLWGLGGLVGGLIVGLLVLIALLFGFRHRVHPHG